MSTDRVNEQVFTDLEIYILESRDSEDFFNEGMDYIIEDELELRKESLDSIKQEYIK